MESQLAPPTLSTPETLQFEPAAVSPNCNATEPTLNDEQFRLMFEIDRTVQEIKRDRFRRIALQFPDHMLKHAPRVYHALDMGLNKSRDISDGLSHVNIFEDRIVNKEERISISEQSRVTLSVLGDTSYGACCIDEIAAEHMDADVVVHYGRSCLSPTARLPVIYVFTSRELFHKDKLNSDIQRLYNLDENPDTKLIIMADVTYEHSLHEICLELHAEGYRNVFEAKLQRDLSSSLPNRLVPEDVWHDPSKLKDWQLVHIGEPPEALLMTLSSRVAGIHIYARDNADAPAGMRLCPASSGRALNRRYALLTSVATASIFGILINTLSVKDYQDMVDHVKKAISAAGKKSYTFVVGKINAAKVANFSEIDAWVVIGCWESSLIESRDFWKPLITPFELELALENDNERIWTGRWSSDYQSLLSKDANHGRSGLGNIARHLTDPEGQQTYDSPEQDLHDTYESAAPEFNLRTGRYVSHTRPMRSLDDSVHSTKEKQIATTTVARRMPGDLVAMAGVHSPGADYLQNKRSWKGLGSDLEIAYEHEGTLLEEGREGIARGYVHHHSESRV